ncbi:hypothetical protein DBR43_08430 [Pedobacter sp. KBW06]|nr:hypothetical protein DBR43_08430 [Pedobacter sp. KBW06]
MENYADTPGYEKYMAIKRYFCNPKNRAGTPSAITPNLILNFSILFYILQLLIIWIKVFISFLEMHESAFARVLSESGTRDSGLR